MKIIKYFIRLATMMRLQKIFLFRTVIFISAFLLFQIELIISKLFLPRFGGSYLVWGGCVAFFQGALLAGYIYAHGIIKRRINIDVYKNLHLLIMAVSYFLAQFMLGYDMQLRLPFAINIFVQLCFVIGPAFFILSTTSILGQWWLVISDLPQKENPYLLYAVSNAGSFAALLSYPFLFEPIFDLKTQVLLWKIGYLFLFFLHLFLFRLVSFNNNIDSLVYGPDSQKDIRTEEKAKWFLFSAAAVVMFLAVTNIVTYEVAPLPLLWVIPLAIYLLSFMLIFKETSWCPAWIKEKFFVLSGIIVLFFFFMELRVFPFPFTFLFLMASLFIVCMFCNYKLYSLRPKAKHNLADFYLFIAWGGFCGGIFTAWILPLISSTAIEYLFAIFIISLAVNIGEEKKSLKLFNLRLVIYLVLVLLLWPNYFKHYHVFGIAGIFFIFAYLFSQFSQQKRLFFITMILILIFTPILDLYWHTDKFFWPHRNYYGIYRVVYRRGVKALMHGTTLHGAQYIKREKSSEPLTYYHPKTPIGELLSSKEFVFKDVAVIGLGTGSSVSYAREYQRWDFYELDKAVYDIAVSQFSYIEKSKAKLGFITGDARIRMSASKKKYDFILIDAFSGDSIPFHLLTTEAIMLYKKHLKENGMIVFHLSNRYLSLERVLISNANVVGAYSCRKENQANEEIYLFATLWVALTWSRASFEKLAWKLHWNISMEKNNLLPWRDTYMNILPILKFDYLLNSIKRFMPFYW
ncbi:MAG: fused MFS/spermidine synthase [Candidatus Omnitrophica bacterium]|nr:fused MFS/spermidine synthase [Candidatus Omnitrophota bacterium]